MGNESGPVARGDGLDGAIRSLSLLLSDMKSPGLPLCTDAMRNLCTRAPEGARWLSTQITRELARVDARPTDQASDHVLPKTLKRRRTSDQSYEPSNRVHRTEEPPQTPADVPHNDNRPSFEQDPQVRDRQIKRLRRENITLVGRLHEALQKVDELHHCARAADPKYTRILNHENVVLRKQLLAIETAREDSGLIGTGSLGPSKKDINANLEVIEDLIADGCASLSLFGRVLDQPKEITNSVLSQLTSTLCGLDFESFVAYCAKHRIDMAIVLRSLVAAALWVLVWRHPLEEIIAEESPILRHYKIQADNPDGPHALHKVELLAYNSLVSEPHFDTQFVAGHTESVLGYMCHILEPLLDSKSNQLGSNELKISDSALLDLFLDVTTRTIELAAKLCLTDRRCIWRFFQPGSIFDPQTMKLVEWTTSGTSRREKEAPSGDVKTVQLCIFPTFYMSKIPGSRASPGGNGHTATSVSDDLGEFQLVAKGLVLIQ
ncbi:hypothetical protein PGQ11_002815 [Apiospora arundinis]|uniref:Uncharacterized protein n=1 Tax=Apiospora arundinis TaxID=335852 RepID=A0ABR2J3D7_9PEZI